MQKFNKGTLVNTRRKYSVNDPQIEPMLIRSRKTTIHSTIDSPLYLTFNKWWLVKHPVKKWFRGLPICSYAVYHEDEIEIVTESEL